MILPFTPPSSLFLRDEPLKVSPFRNDPVPTRRVHASVQIPRVSADLHTLPGKVYDARHSRAIHSSLPFDSSPRSRWNKMHLNLNRHKQRIEFFREEIYR